MAAPLNASATTVVPMDVGAQQAESDLVVLAAVVDQHAFRAEDGHIYTDTVLYVERTLVGGDVSGQELVVRQWGGNVDGTTHRIPGDGALVLGERVVAFLADREPESGVIFLTALAQSVYHVFTTETGDVWLRQNLEGLVFYQPGLPDPFVHPDERPIELDIFIQDLGGAR